MISKESLISLIKEAAYLEGDFTTRAGKKTTYYIDKYLFETKPHILKPLAEHIAALCPDPSTYDRLAAPELGAVPITALVSTLVNKPFVIVRKGNKGYGTQKLIEGDINEGEKVIVIEDILTTAGAVLNACDVLDQANVKINHIVGIINREEGADEAIAARGYTSSSLIYKTELLNVKTVS